MKSWVSYLYWEGLSFLLPMFVFGLISVTNWGYESKLITPDDSAPDWTDVHMGMLLLTVAIGQAVFASFILFIVRITRPKSKNGVYMLSSLILVSIF